MSYAIGAAGTGGHVYPGLAVAEALEDGGIDRSEITFFGGDRLESRVYPARGFPFVSLELRGVDRSLTLRNLALPLVVLRAAKQIEAELRRRRARVVLGMGSYVTVPLGMAARRLRLPFFVHEQNATPGAANRLMARKADAAFVSFPDTHLPNSIHVGNPVRRRLLHFSRPALRPPALDRYGLESGPCTVGIVGGSLGAGAINAAVPDLARSFEAGSLQLIHICGPAHVEEVATEAANSPVRWRVVGFEEEMEYLYAASDLVIARGGGMVAELLVTGTPAVLVPGGFGSAGHQDANATAAEEAGAAVVVAEEELHRLPHVIRELCADADRLKHMSAKAAAASKPQAAARIAAILQGRHG